MHPTDVLRRAAVPAENREGQTVAGARLQIESLLATRGDEWAASMVLRSVDHAIQLGRKLGYVFGLCKRAAQHSSAGFSQRLEQESGSLWFVTLCYSCITLHFHS